MNELDTRAERFLESIRAEGEAACQEIRQQTEQQIEAQLAEVRADQQARADHTVQYETRRAQAQANRMLSDTRMQIRAKLSARREEIVNDTFAAARQQLADFAAGKEYAAWLQDAAKTLAAACGQGTVLHARGSDLPLLADLPAGVTAVQDDTIRLGGLRAENTARGLAADDTLEARLAAQHTWFLQNAGLDIEL